MFRNKRLVLFLVLIVIGTIGGIFLYKNKSNVKDTKQLINISKLSKKFMDNYFEEVSELKKDDKENMLIVISSKKINAKDYGATKVIETPNNKYYLVFEDNVTKQNAINKLNDEPTVLSTEENHKYTFFVDDNQNNNQSSYNSWGIEAMGLDYVSNLVASIDAPEVVVAVLDTGLDVNLFNKYYPGKLKGTYNVLDSNDSMYDNNGHGTHIAGTIAEGTPDNVKIIPVKTSDTASIDECDILAGIEYITYYTDADVINMSFGGTYNSEAQYQAIQAANERNIIAVVAAGNDNSNELFYPAAYDNTISIASVNSNLDKSDFSNFGDTVTFAAPGTDINSIMASYMAISSNNDNDPDHETISGTSMATPHAVAAVAILKSFNKNITLENTIDLLKQSIIDLGGKGFDIYYGNGFINYNDVSFCTNDSMNCDEFNIFKVIEPTNMIVDEVVLTNYNYGSLTNIMGTSLSFSEVDGLDYTKKLWELDDLTVTGYDPYSSEEQTVTVHYLEFEASFSVKNPDIYESGWEYQQSNDNHKYYLSNYKDNGLNIGKLYFPEEIDGLTISGIMDSSNGINSILFGNSNDANNIEEIILPSNIIDIGSFAFNGLTKCTKIISKASEINVSFYSFANMSNLTTVEGSIVFSNEAFDSFENDISLQNITISENTSDILPSYAFGGCISLKNITLPDSITTIDSFAFTNTGLTNIKLPISLIGIENYAFQGSKLSGISWPTSLEKIGDYAFAGNKLESILITENVKEIGIGAFGFNSDLNSIIVAEENEFYNDGENGNIIIETATNKVIQGSTISVIPDSVETIGTMAFYGINVRELNIPEGVTNIEEDAFIFAGLLEKVILPNSLISIDDSVFSYSDDNLPLLGTATSGSYTGIGTTVLWVHQDSYAYNFARNNNRTYVVIEDSSDFIDITDIWFKLKKPVFFPGEKVEDYVDWIEYYYLSGDEVLGSYVNDYTIEYQNGNSITIDDYAVDIIFSLEHSYQNIRLRIPIHVTEGINDLELPTIEVVIGENICNYDYPDGTVSLYECTTFDESGEFTLLGDYKPHNSDEIFYAVEVPIHVLNKELVRDYTSHIVSKIYDGTTNVDPNSIILASYHDNIQQSDYTILSAVLDSPNISPKTLVRITARINDDSYENFAFAGNKQEQELIGYMSVIDLEIPEFTLLIGENFWDNGNEVGHFGSYNTISFEEAGDYNILGYYSCNDGSCMIDDISIPVHVINKRIVTMWPQISPKTYDGTTNIDINTITMDTTMDSSRYSIISAELMSPGVAEWALANVRVRLNDDTYEEYAFSGNKQEENLASMMKVIKGIPNYTIPTNLTGKIGQKLSDIILPSGFDWMDGNQTIDQEGKITFKARYTPSDTNNYEIVENIDITISVSTTEDDSFDYIIHKYSVDETNKYISKIMVDTTSDNFKKNIELGEGYSVVVDSNNNILYTGGKTKIYKNQDVYAEYINIVIGDINGDGAINSADLLKIRQHLLSINILTGPFYIASDINYDSNINSADLLRVRQHLLGTKSIE